MKLPKINKIFLIKFINTLSLLMAIAAIIISYLLFNRREELYNGSKQMATTLNRTASILDKNSGTHTANKVSVTAVMDSYNDSSPLLALQKQANNIIQQRNALGTAIEKIANEIPGAKVLKTGDFDNVNSHKKSIAQLMTAFNEELKQRTSFTKNILKLAETLNVKLPNEKALETSPTPKEYETALAQILKNSIQIREEVNSHKSKLKNVNDNLSKLKIELNKYIDVDSDYKELIKEKDNQNASLAQETLSLSNQIAEYKRIIEQLNQKKNVSKTEQKNITVNNNTNNTINLIRKLHGEVLRFDKKWGNAIINLGKNNKVEVTSSDNEGKEAKNKYINIPLKEGVELIVARDDKFVARIKVKEVFENYSLATILFPLNQELQQGDIVFVPTN